MSRSGLWVGDQLLHSVFLLSLCLIKITNKSKYRFLSKLVVHRLLPTDDNIYTERMGVYRQSHLDARSIVWCRVNESAQAREPG